MTALLVAAAGGLGAAARFAVEGTVRERRTARLPLGTITVNVLGSLLLGLLAGALLAGALPASAYTVAAVGFCGGFTTFSTAMVETVRLARAGDARLAVVNAVGTLVVTLGVAAAGVAVASALLGRA